MTHPDATAQAEIDTGVTIAFAREEISSAVPRCARLCPHELVFTCSPDAPIIVARILTIAVSAQARCSLRLPVSPTVFPSTVAPPVRRLVGIAIPTALR